VTGNWAISLVAQESCCWYKTGVWCNTIPFPAQVWPSMVPCPQGPARAADRHQTGLGIPDLDTVVHQLIDRGAAKSTLISYDSGKRCYLAFCRQFNLAPLPFSSSLSYQSIRSYLSAVCQLQIVSGLPDPSLSSFSCLDYALKGIRRVNAIGPRSKRLPITPAILRQIFGVWLPTLIGL
jgi:hypothetical protein